MPVWAAVDRIEGKQAVLVFDEGSQQIVLPVVSLPSGVREGQVYRVEFSQDEDERLRRLDRVRALQERLRARGHGTESRL